MKQVSKILMLLFVLGIVFTACDNVKNDKETKEIVSKENEQTKEDLEKDHDHGYEMAMGAYQCPMKCEGEKTYAEEGSCPKCKMDLKKVEAASKEEAEEPKSKE